MKHSGRQKFPQGKQKLNYWLRFSPQNEPNWLLNLLWYAPISELSKTFFRIHLAQ